MNHGSDHGGKRGFFASRANIVLIAFLAIGGFFLITEHRAHLIPYLGYLPWLLLLACPFMHLFMHGGHGGHEDNKGDASNGDRGAPHQH